MANALTISSAFIAIDKFTAPVTKMTNAVNKLGNSAATAFAKAHRAQQKLNKGLDKATGNIGGMVKTAGALALGVGASAGAAAFVDFDKSITSASAKFGEFNRESKTFKSFEDVAKNIGATTQFSAGQAAQGLDFLAMAGFSATDAVKALPSVVDLAIVANTDLATATDIASDSLGAFGLKNKDLPVLLDQMGKAAVSSNTSMEMMFEAITEGAPPAVAAGANMETIISLIGQMANAGIKGSKAGTTLKNMYLRLAAPPREAAAALEDLKIATGDSAGDMRDMVEILEDVRKATANMGTKEAAGVMDAIFGKIGIAGATVLVNQGGEALDGFRGKVVNSTGDLQKMSSFMQTSLFGSLQSMYSALESIAIALGSEFRVEIEGVVKSMQAAAAGVKTWITDNRELVKTIANAALFVGKAIIAIKLLGVAFSVVKAGIIAYNVVIGIMGAVTGVANVAIGASSVALAAYNIALTAVTAVQWIFAAAVNAGLWPILLIIAAIAAVILIFKNWGKITEWFLGIWGKFTSLISSAWGSVVNFFKEFDMVLFFKQIGASIVDFLLWPLKKVLEVASSIPGTVGESAGAALAKLNDLTNITATSELNTNATNTPITSPEVGNAKGSVQRYEQTNNQKVEIGIKDYTGMASILSDDGGVPVSLTSTLGY